MDVHLQNAEGFQAAVEESKRAYYQELQRNLEREPTAGGSSAAKKARSRAYALTSLAKVWAPSDKRLVIAGIRCGSSDDGFVQVARKPLDRVRALTAGWSPTFSALDRGSAEERRAFAKKWVTKVDFSDVALPSCDSISSFLAAAGESMPGPDGLPFSSWRATGARGAATLHAVLVHLADGGDVPLWFNDTLGKFAGKGDEEDARIEVTREAQDTRPLGLKNCDNKTIGGTVNMVAKPVLAKSAIWMQRGFVPGRQLIQNVLDIDTFARILGDRGHEYFDATEMPAL